MQNGSARNAWNRHRRLILVGIGLSLLLVGAMAMALSGHANAAFNPFTFGTANASNGWAVKKVQLENVATETAVSGVVRAKLMPVVKEKEGGTEQPISADLGHLPDPGNATELVLGDFTFVMDEDWATHWFYKDGYFYYKQVLPPGGVTKPLLQWVKLTVDTPEMNAKYENSVVEIEIEADILQAEGGAPEEAWGIRINADTGMVDA